MPSTRSATGSDEEVSVRQPGEPLRKLLTDLLSTSVAPSCRGAARMINSASRDSYSDEPEGLGSKTAQRETLSILRWICPRTE
jgi:hypothetical protein